MKTLITFVHFNVENDPIYRNNLDFFIKIGLTNSPSHHFNFIINSSIGGEQIPQQQNISVIKGHNKGYDFGAYYESIQSVNIQEYDYFIFINDTCRGPFLPSYLPSDLSWVDLFLDKIDDKVKMVGSTWFNAEHESWVNGALGIPRGQNTHIQSYCFGVDKTALDLLLEYDKFNVENKNKQQIIAQHEIGCSQWLIKNGYQLKPFQLSSYGNQQNADACNVDGYFGITFNPLEVMFFKTISSSTKQKINPKILENYTQWILQEKKY
jgi:hypothetical protein